MGSAYGELERNNMTTPQHEKMAGQLAELTKLAAQGYAQGQASRMNALIDGAPIPEKARAIIKDAALDLYRRRAGLVA